jgi:hypothetical protein
MKNLSSLSGVSDFDAWKQDADRFARAGSELVAGPIEDAWLACYPEWEKLGRVRDLSRSIRLTKYWPSFATQLGELFGETHWRDYGFVLHLLRSSPVDSTPYLCAVDLLVDMAWAFARRGLPVPEDLRECQLPLPPVIVDEISGSIDYEGLESGTVGQLIVRETAGA